MRPFDAAPRVLLLGAALLHTATLSAQTDPRFADLDARIASGQLGPITSLLVQHGNTRLHEAYFHGASADQLQELFSVTKSVGATLIGMAERRGLLRTTMALPSLIPRYAWDTPPFNSNSDMRLHDVLTMRHGLDWDEWSLPFFHPGNSHQQMLQTSDWYRFVLSRARLAEPDSRFTYSTGVSTLMSGVLRQTGLLDPEQLFVQWLAQRLGIEQHRWQVRTGFEPGDVTRVFPMGDVPLGVGLWLRPRDLLRIGELYLNRGIHGNQRLLDASWIDRSWTGYSHAENDDYFAGGAERRAYGYQWWFNEFIDVRDRKVGCWYASGAGRQYLFVCPSLELLVVSTSILSGYDGPGMGQAMRETILPAFEQLNLPDPQVSGLWYDPSTPGQGFSLQQVDGGLFGHYYGYDGGMPLWLITDVHRGPVRFGETIQVDVGMPTGGVFGAPRPPAQGGVALWGTLELRFVSCVQAEARLQGLSGTQQLDLALLVGIDGFDVEDCTSPPVARPMADSTGAWFDPATAGQGWHLFHTPFGLVGFFFGYDRHGEPLWLMSSPMADLPLGEAREFDLYAGREGGFDTPVPPQQMRHWGTVEFELSSCRAGVARMAGEDGEQVQPLQMLAGVPGLPGCQGDNAGG